VRTFEANSFVKDVDSPLLVGMLLLVALSENPINGKTLHKGPVAHVMGT